MTSLKDARKALAAQIGAAGLDGVTVYDYEPPIVTAGTSVTVSTAGFGPTEWRLSVRVYVSDTVPQTAQDRLDEVAPAVDAALAVVPRGDWDTGYDEDRGVFFAVATVEYPREDF